VILLQGHGLSFSAGTKSLFKDIDFTVNEGDKIGLVGHNGAGKSTLLAILSGELEQETGDISRRKDLYLETVEQFLSPELEDLTLLGAVIDKLSPEERDYSAYKAEKLLHSLGFKQEEFDYRIGDLSGGQQNRLMFARAVINEPNLILFDEPTNHLDMKTLVFFEQYLQGMKTAFVIISHDRSFLDTVTHRTIFLRDERLYEFSLPYSDAKQALADHDDAAAQKLKQEEKTIKQLTASAKRLATWGKVYDNEDLAAKAKNMEKRIERLEAEKTFVTRGSGLKLELDLKESKANRALQVEQEHIVSPDSEPLFFVRDFYLKPGDRVALLGHNGAGKSTFIRELVEAFNQRATGSIRFNPKSELGYYDQELEHLDPGHTLLSYLREACHRGTETEYKAGLIHAGFKYADHDKKVGGLSGGEKARLMFLAIRINQPNFLILDEPTNYIDIQGKEELEAQILETNATVLITSHDRRFVDNITNRYVMIKDGGLVELNRPSEFYESLLGHVNKPDSQAEHIPRVGSTTADDGSEEQLLAQLIELEEKLEADLNRKAKFQKPAKQEAWRKDIERLKQQLDNI
jgi:ATPase subunit of ABC transporter with duplicated ATPase domains